MGANSIDEQSGTPTKSFENLDDKIDEVDDEPSPPPLPARSKTPLQMMNGGQSGTASVSPVPPTSPRFFPSLKKKEKPLPPVPVAHDSSV